VNRYFRDSCGSSCQLGSGQKCEDDYSGCLSHSSCDDKDPYSIIAGTGACYGDSGCEDFCTGELVDTDGVAGFDMRTDNCNCDLLTIGEPCDSDFDGVADGTCGLLGGCST
jgi:hypothetical protein